MLVRSALVLLVLTSGAQAAAFDDLRGYLASCLRFELRDPALQRSLPLSAKVRVALDRCGDDVARLDRADGRRLRGDGGISPSTKAVIQSVASPSGGGLSPVRYRTP